MNTKELRKEWCEKKGFNYIDFETLSQAEEYILFLEERIQALTIPVVVGQSEQLICSVCGQEPNPDFYEEGDTICVDCFNDMTAN